MPIGVKFGSWEEENVDWALDIPRNGHMGLNAVAQTLFCYGSHISLVALQTFLKTLKWN
jgi:hypothetical protein